jgi:hypothetical protein
MNSATIIMNMISDGGENDGNDIQVKAVSKSKIKEIVPAMRIKYLLKSFKEMEFLTKLIL